jgi:hypothetical protein
MVAEYDGVAIAGIGRIVSTIGGRDSSIGKVSPDGSPVASGGRLG